MKTLDKNITAIPQWDESAQEIWDNKFKALTENSDTVAASDVPLEQGRWRRISLYIASAVAVLLIAFSATAFLYTKDINTARGKMIEISLPDGSVAQLSAGTSISYKPLLWWVRPSATLSGQAYFSGNHAKGLTIETQQGQIRVLGTTFVVNTLSTKLLVACLQGKVEFRNGTASALLTDNMQTVVDNGKIETTKIVDKESIVGWTKGIFSYDNKPLDEVVKDIERYYNINVESPAGIDTLRYSGRFTNDKAPQEVLSILGRPYGLTFNIKK